jgi:hypothetical protein
MIHFTYNINNLSQTKIQGVEYLTEQDSNLINQYKVNSLFDKLQHYIELHITDLLDNPITENLNYTSYRILGDSQQVGKQGASMLYIDTLSDIDTYGVGIEDVKLVYHFLNDLFTNTAEKALFFIQEISADRLELKLNTTTLSGEDLKTFTGKIKENLTNSSYLNNYRLNFQDNNFPIVINIDTFEESNNTFIIVKLYQPLPTAYREKSILNIVEIVSDSISYEITTSMTEDEQDKNYISPANFNLNITDEQIVPTEYLSYDTLLSFPVDNTNSKLYSIISEKSAELSINYSDYIKFINFSSLYERLSNFKYKLQLLEQYSSSLDIINTTQQFNQSTTGSRDYYENLIKGLISNLDHYEKHLYYASGSTAWPKINSTAPYVNKPATDPEAISWYNTALQNAILYDSSNYNNLTNTIPSYLLEDPDNENYRVFVSMIGQHFDNLWIYAEHLTDKYSADNRLDRGISKDLVKDVLVNFGINIYTSKKSIENLFNSLINQTATEEGEIVNYYITGSIQGTNTAVPRVSYDDYQKEVYKRIYHNLPLLLKSKGTERGLRALINCFGIPSEILSVKMYGGLDVDGATILSDAAYVTSSLEKIRLDNTGVTLPENTLSSLTKTHTPGKKYTEDSHVIEVGFSPTDDVNRIITAELPVDFDLDNYLGDPRNLYKDSYELLDAQGNTETSLHEFSQKILNNLGKFNIKDYVRLIKFFDNVIFKMVKDFIPARSTANVGVIIKPHVLDRSKIKSTQADVTFHHYTGSIETGYITGSHGSVFGGRNQHITNYTETVQTPLGLAAKKYHIHSVAQFDGEFSQSLINVTDGEVSRNNTVKYNTYSSTSSLVTLIEAFPTGVYCNINTLNRVIYIRGTSSDTRVRNLIPDFSVGIGNDNVKYYEVTGETPSSAHIYITNAAGEVGMYDIDERDSSRISYILHVENTPFIGYVNIRASRGLDTSSATVAFRIENDIYGPLSLEVNSDIETSTLVNIPVGVYYCDGEAYGARAQGSREAIVDGDISYGYTQVFAEGLPNTFANVRYDR